MCITGNNFQRNMGDFPYSYYFSRYNHCWGWASWRRAWRLYDAEMKTYPDFLFSAALNGMSLLTGFSDYWQDRFNEVAARRVDSWAYVWTYSCWANNGLTCTPRVNLVSNIGFGSEATHTLDAQSPFASMAVGKLERPLRHPSIVAPHNRFDSCVDRYHFYIGWNQPRTVSHVLIDAMKFPLRRLRSLVKRPML
jgi:hypothetical protein